MFASAARTQRCQRGGSPSCPESVGLAEREVLIHERRRELRRRGVEDVPAQIRLPRLERHLVEQAVRLADVLRLGDVERAQVGEAERR